MKIKAILVSALLLGGFLAAPASATEKPTVVSFTYTPTEVDLLGADTKVNFELVVSHPNGIDNTSTFATLKNNRNDTLGAYLTRTDSNSATSKVTFKGSLSIPRDINTGVYYLTAAEVKNNSSAGYQYGTGTITAGVVRTLVGAESGLLVRTGGDLNYAYPTIVGPSYDTITQKTFLDPKKYASSSAPIWKVGESFNPATYFELQVSGLPMVVTSSTPTTCPVSGSSLSLIKEGTCSFIVSTAKTKDYLATAISQSVTITAARIKPMLTLDKIADQTSKDLPKSVAISPVYSVAEGYVQPTTLTPSVCLGSAFFVRILAGGTCTLTYKTAATASFLESDLYTVSFTVTRDAQTISFAPATLANVRLKTLALTASASSAGGITYATTSTGICSISGSTLTLLKAGSCAVTATQAGTSTIAPVSATATIKVTGIATKKVITCVKGKVTKKVSKAKCPKGFKLKK